MQHNTSDDNPNNDTPYQNPYAVSHQFSNPSIVDLPLFRVSIFAWLGWIAILCTSIAVLVVSLSGLHLERQFSSVLGISSSIFGMIRSWLFARRLNQVPVSLTESLFTNVNQVQLFFSSLFWGFLATLASCIAFVVTCVPTGFAAMTIEHSISGPLAQGWTILIAVIICGGLGLAFGLFCTWRSLPKYPAPEVNVNSPK